MAKEKQISVKQYAADEMDGQSILGDILDSGLKTKDEKQQQHAQDLIGNLLEQISQEEQSAGRIVAPGVSKFIQQRIAAIDEVISKQLSAVMHHEKFLKLEGSWRGLHKFVQDTETGEMLRIRLLDVSKKELLDDFRAKLDYDQSALHDMVYRSEFGTYGGDAYGALVGDFNFDKGPEDIELLQEIASVSAMSHAPFITSPGPGMFGLDSWTELPDPISLQKKMDKTNPENAQWLSFRDSEDSRYVAMTMPRVLARVPYGAKTRKIDSFGFEEDITGYDHDKFCWSSAAYAFAGNMTEAFAKHHWCTAIRGPEGGGAVTGLPVFAFKTEEGDTSAKCPTEVVIPDSRELELSELGFIGLCHCKNTDYGAFFGGNAVQKPKEYIGDDAATANADLSRKIPYLLATSRIAHYLKAMGRDKTGGFMTRKDCEDYLNKWIKTLVLDQESASAEQKAKYPLRKAAVEVLEDKARPGVYKAVAYLMPHFQLEELNVSLRLVAELPEHVR